MAEEAVQRKRGRPPKAQAAEPDADAQPENEPLGGTSCPACGLVMFYKSGDGPPRRCPRCKAAMSDAR
jgi:rubrerythrin